MLRFLAEVRDVSKENNKLANTVIWFRFRAPTSFLTCSAFVGPPRPNALPAFGLHLVERLLSTSVHPRSAHCPIQIAAIGFMNFFPPRFVLARLLRNGFDISAVPCRFPSRACCALGVRPTRHRTTAAFRTCQKGNWATMGRLDFRRPSAVADTIVEGTSIGCRNQPRNTCAMNINQSFRICWIYSGSELWNNSLRTALLN